jgi:hypothetical protein
MNRWVLAILALVIGFGVGWLAFRPKEEKPEPRMLAAGPQGIYVYQKNDDDDAEPDVDVEQAYITTDDVVVWRQRGKKKKDLHIEFKEEAFSGMTKISTPQGDRWAITNCKAGGCVSGWPKGTGDFKYWQRVNDPGNPNGHPKEKDGWIIIR